MGGGGCPEAVGGLACRYLCSRSCQAVQAGAFRGLALAVEREEGPSGLPVFWAQLSASVPEAGAMAPVAIIPPLPSCCRWRRDWAPLQTRKQRLREGGSESGNTATESRHLPATSHLSFFFSPHPTSTVTLSFRCFTEDRAAVGRGHALLQGPGLGFSLSPRELGTEDTPRPWLKWGAAASGGRLRSASPRILSSTNLPLGSLAQLNG